jgi:hypothetical protein
MSPQTDSSSYSTRQHNLCDLGDWLALRQLFDEEIDASSPWRHLRLALICNFQLGNVRASMRRRRLKGAILVQTSPI